MKIMLLPSILILVWVLNHNIRKSNRRESRTKRTFLERESAANSTRRQDISALPYIKIPLDAFPLDITLKDEKMQLKISQYKDDIIALSEKPMLNLIGITNTELKELYGPANLEQLTICDQNYSLYIRTLHLFASCIYDEYPDKAVSMLEYCLTIGTDISGTYDILGKYYLNHQEQEKFEQLYERIPDKDSIAGKTIMNKLAGIQSLYTNPK